MERVVLKSSAIAEVGYDAEAQVLEVMFPSKAVWRYYAVPQAEYDGLMRAESAGHYFAVSIRANYQARRLHADGWTHEAKCTDETCWCAKLTATSRETEKTDAEHTETKMGEARATTKGRSKNKLRTGI